MSPLSTAASELSSPCCCRDYSLVPGLVYVGLGKEPGLCVGTTNTHQLIPSTSEPHKWCLGGPSSLVFCRHSGLGCTGDQGLMAQRSEACFEQSSRMRPSLRSSPLRGRNLHVVGRLARHAEIHRPPGDLEEVLKCTGSSFRKHRSGAAEQLAVGKARPS